MRTRDCLSIGSVGIVNGHLKIRSWLAGWLGAAIMVLIGCGPTPDSAGGAEPLVVGMELSYPPFEMSDENGLPTGVSVDMAMALGAFLGREVRIENIPFDGLIPALKTGRIDLVISSMTETVERARSIDFSDPYLRTGLCLLISRDSPVVGMENLDLPGVMVAVKKGTTGHEFARQHLAKAEVLVLDKESAAVLEVVQGKADAFIYDQMSVYQHWKRHQPAVRAVLKPFREEAWAIGIRAGNDGLTDDVNRFLAHFKAEQGFAKLGDKYLAEQKEAFRKLGYPFFF